MTENAIGLVMRLRPLTETSLIVHWLTQGQGRLATVAKGALRPKSPFRGKLDLFYLADFSFTRSRRSDLHTLSEVSLRETHPALRQSIEHLQQLSYCAGLVEVSTETETPLLHVYELLLALVSRTALHPARPETVFAFELKLLKELGLAPDIAESRLSPGAASLARSLMNSPPDLVSRLHATAGQQKELAQYLHGFLTYHLEKLPRGRSEALSFS